MSRIRVAIAGVGNCASALVQGVGFYSQKFRTEVPGLIQQKIGDYRLEDIEFVAAFDIDKRKVGKPLTKAIFARPNCTPVFFDQFEKPGPIVTEGIILDGVANHMKEFPVEDSFDPIPMTDQATPGDLVRVLQATKADVLVNYMPVGSEMAAQAYANAALEAGVAFINCMPVFIASKPELAKRFTEKGVPIIGDDIKSQVGATIVHRALAKLMSDRGYEIKHMYQLNVGGNTDFLNMKNRHRLESKKISKTQAVTSQVDQEMAPRDVHVGPSDYVPWLEDHKIAMIRIEGEGFGGAPISIDVRMDVVDSPNSAGVVVDAIRYAKLALDAGIGGPLLAPSAYLMKSPPTQIEDAMARELCKKFESDCKETMDYHAKQNNLHT